MEIIELSGWVARGVGFLLVAVVLLPNILGRIIGSTNGYRVNRIIMLFVFNTYILWQIAPVGLHFGWWGVDVVLVSSGWASLFMALGFVVIVFRGIDQIKEK